MATGILVIGESGSGKSASIENLNSKETFIIAVKAKSLPFRGGNDKYSVDKKNYFVTDQSSLIVSTLRNISEKATYIKNVVIDDAQYVAADEFMSKASEKGYDKFNIMAKNVYNMVDVVGQLRDDLKVFYLWHSETVTDADGITKVKAKTIGRMLDQYITIEGLFTYVVLTDIEKTKEGMKYRFVTNTDGRTTAKTPKEMFEYKIPNDLQLVSQKIDEYNNVATITIKKEKLIAA